MSRPRWQRRLTATLAPPLVRGLIQVLWRTCRIRLVVGEEHLVAALEQSPTLIPCYWHREQIFCVRYLIDRVDAVARTATRPFSLGYLVSPSDDGDMATRMFGALGLRILRGSATRGGAQALRDIYLAMKSDAISPIITPDGPTGPVFEVKPGVVMLAQLSGAPLLPIACGASRCWSLRTWDRFVIPYPFSDIVVVIGAPVVVAKRAGNSSVTTACATLTDRLNRASSEAARLAKSSFD